MKNALITVPQPRPEYLAATRAYEAANDLGEPPIRVQLQAMLAIMVMIKIREELECLGS